MIRTPALSRVYGVIRRCWLVRIFDFEVSPSNWGGFEWLVESDA